MNDESLAQGSAAWLFARVGHATASNFRKVLAKLKNGSPAKERDDYCWQIVIERLTGAPTDNFVNAAMQRGSDLEPMARMKYEATTGAMVEETGFAHHPDMPFVGASCDGLVGDDGMIEIKCPFNSAIHLRTILEGMPMEHMAQVQGCLWVTGRKWADFISYDDRMPDGLDLYVQRIPRDEEFIASLAVEVADFLRSVDALANTLQGLIPARPATPDAAESHIDLSPLPEISPWPSESHTLSAIDKAIDSEMAAICLDMARGSPYYDRAAAAFTARWTKGENE